MPATKHDEYRTSLARAVDAKSAWASGEVRWSPTVLRLEDPAFLAERRLECGRKYGSGIKEVCNYQVDTVVERTGATEGKVVYVEARVLDEQPETGCPEFAGCIGESRRGEILPLPAGEEPLISVSQKLQSTPLPDYMKDPKHLQKLVAHFQAANERARVQVQDGDLKVVHAVTDRENAIRYMQRKLAAMELER